MTFSSTGAANRFTSQTYKINKIKDLCREEGGLAETPQELTDNFCNFIMPPAEHN